MALDASTVETSTESVLKMPEISHSQILVFQSAFLGDVILTLPMIQLLHKNFSSAAIDLVVTPQGAEIVRNNPHLRSIIPYDKRKSQKGIAGIIRLSRVLARSDYDIAVVPHRSLRSAMIVRLAGIPRQIGFTSSAGRWLFTDTVPYNSSLHEIERNISLLLPLSIVSHKKEYPALFPSDEDIAKVDAVIGRLPEEKKKNLIAVAPGSAWNTKRWGTEKYRALLQLLRENDFAVAVIGGEGETELCNAVAGIPFPDLFNMAGKLSLLQSAELIKRCSVLVTNDSAPLHLAAAMRTRVVAIFGATVPAFGFAPYGDDDIVVEREGLPCRPCAIHGGNECPIGTFECMRKISPEQVFQEVIRIK